MPNAPKRSSWRYRALLTETLPYELPVIFGNDQFYHLTHRNAAVDVEKLLQRLLRPLKKSHTIPYCYQIRKDNERFTTLGIIHPLMQREFCEFYEDFQSSILDYCNRSSFSLRRPAALAAVYSATVDGAGQNIEKDGWVHQSDEDPELELSRLVSYFAYEKYNLLNKFYESAEFIRLEKRFSHLRQIDVSRCFNSIYTHTISWAVKSKEFAKENIGAYSFDGVFDSLMQRSNYRETNGVIIGPEVSRIFAEIILQSIDRSIEIILRSRNLQANVDYAIRRYVDDYSIFASSSVDLDDIENVVRVELEKFKLYINESKLRNFSRPFVSSLTLARADVKNRLSAAKQTLASDSWKGAQKLSSFDHGSLVHLARDIRMIVSRYDVQFGSISGAVLGELRSLVRMANSSLGAPIPANPASSERWFLAAKCVVDCALYMTAVDLRVRTTYSLCQLVKALLDKKKLVATEHFDQIEFMVLEELTIIAKNAAAVIRKAKSDDFLELYNLLICGAYLLGRRFVASLPIKKILDELLARKITYFSYITIKYCYLTSMSEFSVELGKLNLRVEGMLSNEDSLRENCELFHLFCDYLSAPDILAVEKRQLFVKIFGGNPAANSVERLGTSVGFVDWAGMRVEHTLRRRQLRPVYAMA